MRITPSSPSILPASDKETSPWITELAQRHVDVLVVLILRKVSNTTRDADGTPFTISPLDSTFLGKSTLCQSHKQRASVPLRTLDD